MPLVIPDYSKVYCMSKYCVRYSYLLFAIIPAILFLYWFIRKTFVKFSNKLEQQDYLKTKLFDRKIVFLLRGVSITLLIIALASPFILESKDVPGNPRLTILVDNSSSMAVFRQGMGLELYKKLEGSIPVNVRTISGGEKSAIGDGILNNIEGGDNVLVISDGNNNEGKLLGDIMLFASSINSSVSTLEMSALKSDVSVTISGPPELIKDSDGEFIVKVNVVGGEIPYTLQVTLDDNLVVEQKDSKSTEYRFERKFSEGKYHKITAKIIDVGDVDYFSNNNEYYKSVKIVPRPKLLFVTDRSSPLADNMGKIYDVEITNSIPEDLSNYMAVMLNNLPSVKILPRFDVLSDYVSNGNGLVFIGGDKSFESGSYKGTIIESLLPVKMGSGEEENKSDSNIVVVIDISQGTENYIGVEKALALSVMDSLNEKNNVGVVAFGGPPPCEAYKIADIRPLKEFNKDYSGECDGRINDPKNLYLKIKCLKFDGQSCFDLGIGGGYELLKDAGGSKSLIFISDGKATGNFKLKEDTIEKVRQINARGVKVYVVGVGTDTDSASSENNLFLSNMAVIGEGIYFKADASNRLKILFGEPPKNQREDEFFNSLVILDSTHFITEDLDLSATIGGYNYVLPKSSARLLISTNKNIPILTVWRYGLGRVAAISTDDGLSWAGELLNKKNSKMITRSINWVIGDLSRKQSFDVTIRDTALGEKGYVNVVSKEMPSSSKLSFAKVDTNYYIAEFTPAESGFKEEMEATYAVNYGEEYSKIGVNEEFLALVEKTGGKVFNENDIDGLIEFLKTKSKRIKINSTNYKWPFALIALMIFLMDIAYRRIRENKGG